MVNTLGINARLRFITHIEFEEAKRAAIDTGIPAYTACVVYRHPSASLNSIRFSGLISALPGTPCLAPTLAQNALARNDFKKIR